MTPEHSRWEAPRPAERRARTWLVLTTLALTGTVVSLQQTLVLTPRLLDTTADNASWLVTATLLTGAVATPTISRLADMFGKKRMMMVALGVMILGSVLGAFSQALPLVIAARALQGVGMALIPVGIAIMRDELPREKVPLGVALMSATLAIGAGAGMPLSGLISEHIDWHSIFWVTAVAGTVMLAGVALVLGESPVRTRGSFDYRGAVLLSGALTSGLLALSKGGQWGWASPTTLLLSGVGVVLLLIWAPFELWVRNPLVDVRVAARPAVLLVNVASVLTGFAMFANMLVTTQLLQLPASSGYGLGLDVLETGLWMAPSALVFGVMAPVAASVTRRFGPLTTLLVGSLLMSGSYVARVFLSHELWQIVTGSMLVGVGTSMAYAAMPTLIMRAVPVTETASANGLNTLLRSIGTSASSATMAAVTTIAVQRVGGNVFPRFDALTGVFWLAALMSLVSGLLVIPMWRMSEYADEPPEAAEHRHDSVVHGRVVSSSERPVRNAVVTLLTPGGDQVDWSQVDPAGDFSVAMPGAGRYVVVAAAEGWRPQSQIVDLTAGSEIDPIVLPERLTMSGVVTAPAGPVAGAVLVLTRQAGEAAGTTTSGCDGYYELPLPPNRRYVMTAVAGSTAVARAVTIWGAARVLDLEVPDLEVSDAVSTERPGTEVVR